VEFATSAEEALLLDLLKFYNSRKAGPFGLLKPGQQVKLHIAWMDSLRLKFRAEQDGIIESNSELKRQGDSWQAY
jgi:hypothetical protein